MREKRDLKESKDSSMHFSCDEVELDVAQIKLDELTSLVSECRERVGRRDTYLAADSAEKIAIAAAHLLGHIVVINGQSDR